MNWTQPANLLNADFLEGYGALIGPMLRACTEGDLETVKALLQQEPSFANHEFAYFTPLHFAAREDHEEIVKLLLDYGADATHKSELSWQESPIGIAGDRELKKVAALMEGHVREKFSISPAGQEICAAVRDGDLGKVELLLNENPDLIRAADERGNAPLHWAVMMRHLDMIEFLSARGADVDAARRWSPASARLYSWRLPSPSQN